MTLDIECRWPHYVQNSSKEKSWKGLSSWLPRDLMNRTSWEESVLNGTWKLLGFRQYKSRSTLRNTSRKTKIWRTLYLNMSWTMRTLSVLLIFLCSVICCASRWSIPLLNQKILMTFLSQQPTFTPNLLISLNLSIAPSQNTDRKKFLSNSSPLLSLRTL